MHPLNIMQVFSPEWFEHHQAKLLWLCNHWLTRRWFKWILCIRKYDIGYARRIMELGPHFYTVLAGESQLTSDFRTHPKFAKRIYYAFRPLWFTLHFWDWLLADRWVPRLSFGFATLTVYPDPSSGATTVDGRVAREGVDETFATIRAGAGTFQGQAATPQAIRLTGSTTANQFQICGRFICLFDTSPLGAGATLASATLSLYGVNTPSNGLGDSDMHICASSPAADNALVTSDYGQLQNTSFGSFVWASFTVSAYNDIGLNASGLSNVSLTGISKFGAQLAWDINASFTGVWASAASTFLSFASADAAGTANDPKLVVTYNTLSNYILDPNNIRPGRYKPGNAR